MVTTTLPVDEIVVEGRHREDLGDLTDLRESVAAIGLLNPVAVTPDKRLVAGRRRLEVFRELNRRDVPVTWVDSLTDAKKLLEAERDENTCRLPMKPSELVSLGRALEALERPKALQRRREGKAPGPRTGTSGETREVVGKAIGLSGSSYSRASALVAAAEAGDEQAKDLVEEMDATGKITPAYNKFKGRVSAPSGPRSQPQPDDDGDGDPLWVPQPKDNRRKAVTQRGLLVKHYAGQGSTSEQVAKALGITPQGVRKIAQKIGLTITADQVVGKGPRIDSKRVADQIVMGLDSVMAGADLIDFAVITKQQAAEWLPVLAGAQRDINGFVKKIKEIAQ